MGNEHRRQKKAEKQKERARERSRRAEGKRVRREPTPISADKAAHWPFFEAWASMGWHDPGARVHALFGRRHDDGAMAALIIEADLADQGLVRADVITGLDEARFRGELGRLSDDDTLIEADPIQVARLLHDASQWTRAQGFDLPSGAAAARAFLGDLDPQSAPWAFTVGDPEEDAPTEETFEEPKGLLDRIKRRFGLA